MKATSILFPSLLALGAVAHTARAQADCGVFFAFTPIGEPCCTTCRPAIEHRLGGSAEPVGELTYVTFDLLASAPHPEPHLLLLGLERAAVPIKGLDAECSLLPSPDFVLTLGSSAPQVDDLGFASNRWHRTLVAPHDPALAGVTLFAQALHVDASRPPVGVVSNGLQIDTE